MLLPTITLFFYLASGLQERGPDCCALPPGNYRTGCHLTLDEKKLNNGDQNCTAWGCAKSVSVVRYTPSGETAVNYFAPPGICYSVYYKPKEMGGNFLTFRKEYPGQFLTATTTEAPCLLQNPHEDNTFGLACVGFIGISIGSFCIIRQTCPRSIKKNSCPRRMCLDRQEEREELLPQIQIQESVMEIDPEEWPCSPLNNQVMPTCMEITRAEDGFSTSL